MTADRHSFEFALAIYRLAAIKKAAYRYLDSYRVEFSMVDDGKVRVEMFPLRSNVRDLTAFSNEVLDQELREIVAEETKSVRDLLLAQAFSGLSVVDPVGEEADFRADPLGIAGTSRGPTDVAR